MTKDIWINLPVKDVQRSKAFFTAMGFKFNEARSAGADMACMLIGENEVIVMLFREDMFTGFTQAKLSDTNQGSEVLISIDAATKEDVDAFAKNAVTAGGKVYGKPAENQGWMYGCGIIDLDGHRWNALHMDLSKMPK